MYTDLLFQKTAQHDLIPKCQKCFIKYVTFAMYLEVGNTSTKLSKLRMVEISGLAWLNIELPGTI